MSILYKHQQEFLAKNPDKCSLVWSCGTGKTRTAIEWAMKTHSSIIICPKALKANWIRECERWGLDSLRVLVITKEEFRKGWDVYSGYESLICDEVHNGFLTPNFKSQMSKALKSYLKKHNVPRVLLLSATVYTSSPWNIYNLAYYTGHVWDYMKFKYKFFIPVPMGLRTIWMPKKNIDDELAGITRQIASVVDIHDCMDVPEQLHLDPEYFSLTKEQEKAIKDAYDPMPIVRYTYQHEIENGILIGNEFRDSQTFDHDKLVRILALCMESNKVAVICRYNLQIDLLKGVMTQYCLDSGTQLLVIRGDVDNRDEITLQAEGAEKVIVLIQADCNAGYQLPSFELCIFASMSYSYVAHEQLCGRFLRMDKPSRTTFMYLLTEGDSMDQAVFDAVKRREDFQVELYEKRS